MKDFWLSCGHHLLDRDASGGLALTDEFLKVYLARPELIPPPEACAVERTLHGALLADPRMEVAAAAIAAIADADARENWQVLIAFRDLLLRHETLEGAYAELMRSGPGKTPLLFVNQLVHVILRNARSMASDARVVRAAELFFRTQRVTVHENSLIAADEGPSAESTGRRVRRWCGCWEFRPRPPATCSTMTMPRAIGSAATASTWRSISPPGAKA